MSAPIKILDPHFVSLFQQNVVNSVCEGLQETLKMMNDIEVTFEKSSFETSWKTQGEASGIIDFEAEKFKGSLYIHFPFDVLVKLYNQMIGENHTEFSDEIMNCIGEISNMAYGVAKTKLDRFQFKLSMSIPKVSKTKDLKRIPSPHFLIPFKIHDQLCHLELTISPK